MDHGHIGFTESLAEEGDEIGNLSFGSASIKCIYCKHRRRTVAQPETKLSERLKKESLHLIVKRFIRVQKGGILA